MINEGVDINQPYDVTCPIGIAYDRKDITIVKHLLRRGADAAMLVHHLTFSNKTNCQKVLNILGTLDISVQVTFEPYEDPWHYSQISIYAIGNRPIDCLPLLLIDRKKWVKILLAECKKSKTVKNYDVEFYMC